MNNFLKFFKLHQGHKCAYFCRMTQQWVGRVNGGIATYIIEYQLYKISIKIRVVREVRNYATIHGYTYTESAH